MSNLIREYNLAVNKMARVISEHAAVVQKKHDATEWTVRFAVEREFVGMMQTLHIHPQGPAVIADRDERVRVATLIEACKALKGMPKAVAVLRRRLRGLK